MWRWPFALGLLLLVCAPAAATEPTSARSGTATQVITLPPGVDANQLLEQLDAAGPRRRAVGEDTRRTEPTAPAISARDEPFSPEEEFERFVEKIVREGRLDEERRARLEERAAELGLEREAALEITERIAEKRQELLDFFLTQTRALALKDELGPEDRRFLQLRGRDQGLDFWETEEIIELSLERLRRQELYRSIIDAFLEDGILDASERKRLDGKRQDLDLTDEEHEEIFRETQDERREFAKDVLAEIRDKSIALGPVEEELELYGHSLFESAPETFAPTIGLPPPDSYVVGPGDQFHVSLWGRLEADYLLTVDGEGRVHFPKVGALRVGRLTYGEVKELLTRRAESITGVTAAVTLAETRSIRVFVVGEIEKPGSVILTPLSTAIHAIMAAGGPTPLGSLRSVRLRRAGKIIAEADLYGFLRRGETGEDRPAENGDVVVVPRAELLVRLYGQVRRPAIYELTRGEGIRALLEYAGGLAPDAYGGRVQVERAERHESRIALDVSLSQLKGDFPLEDGDLVRVFALKPEIENRVGLFGHVYHPGFYAHTPGARVRDLVGSAENLKPGVDLAYAVVLRETGPERTRTVLPFHLGKALDGSEPGENLTLQPVDEVYVFARQQFRPPLRAQATGEVRAPGLYKIETGARVADLVRLAGGLRPDALLGRAELLRYLPNRTRETLYVDLESALEGDPEENLALADEDELVVHPVWDQSLEKVVLIEGEVKGTEEDRFRRGKSVQQRFTEILQQEQEAREITDQPDGGKSGSSATDRVSSRLAQATGREIDEKRTGREAPEAIEVPLTRGMTVRDLIFKAGGLTRDAYLPLAHLYRTDPITKKVTIHTFHLGKALGGDPDADLALQDLDHLVVHSAFDFTPIQRVTVAGMVNRPGDYPYAVNMRALDLVLAAGGLTEDAYLADAEVVRTEVIGGETAETRTITFSIERALKDDREANLPLEPYDKLLIKKIPEWKETRAVEVAGQLRFPGTYYIAKGERLSAVLRRAGGYTEEAYPRGGVFTRERARVQQQERLDDLRDRLQQTILRASSAEVQAALSPEDVAAQKQFLASQQALIKRLEAVRATGRVVTRFLPLSELAGSEWDMPLEDGDTVTIPKKPQTVAVVGQVYNPTSLLWESDNRTMEHYLDRTGGPTPDAEEDEIYVVRADGTVVSSKSAESRSWWSRGIMDLELYAGDTILVPEKAVRISWMKEFKDITQILYQIALSAGVFIVLM